MLIAAIGFAVICPRRNTRRRRIWIASSESRRSGAGQLKRRSAEHSQSDVDDKQFGGSGRVDVQSARADHARRIVRPQALEVDVRIALDHVDVAAVPRLELVRHTPARGIESYDAYFRVLRNHESVARRTFRPHDLQPAFEAIVTREMVVLL